MNKANKIMPYLLPIITVVTISIIFIIKPEGITGFVIAPEVQNDNTAKIEIRISNTTMVPINSIVEIMLNNQTYTLSIEEFIQKSGNTPKLIYGEIPEINYSGKGYIGDYSVSVDTLGLSTNNISTRPRVYIIHKDIVISSNIDSSQNGDNQKSQK